MEVLIIGLSSIVKRRVLPALQRIPEVQRIDLATRKAADASVRHDWTHGEVYSDYAEALKRTSAQAVYISLVNSAHETWTEAALQLGFHVMVDKPGFLGYERTARMVDIAAKQDRCLAEATVFGYHPQIGVAFSLFADAGDAPKRISMALSFPPMDDANFRYQANLGGGALWDVGPYLVATSRLFFGAEPVTVDCRVLSRREGDLETAFTALGTFPDGRSLAGQFGFDTAYLNRLSLVGDSMVLDIDRVFTTPPDYRSTIRVTGPKVQSLVEVPTADAFTCFFERVFGLIKAGDWESLTADLLSDSRLLERYRNAAGSN